jgi:hypothetical protein
MCKNVKNSIHMYYYNYIETFVLYQYFNRTKLQSVSGVSAINFIGKRELGKDNYRTKLYN